MLPRHALSSLASFVWRKRSEATRSRLTLSEETITELLLLKLKTRYPGDVQIVQFNKRREAAVGADWAWAFVNSDQSQIQPILVQAKALDRLEAGYRDLNRNIGNNKAKPRQIDVLLQRSRETGWPAIYAFYNYLSKVERIPNTCPSIPSELGPSTWGVSIAEAQSVNLLLPDVSFAIHSPKSRPLHCLLCPHLTVDTAGQIESPTRVLEALRFLRQLSGPGIDDFQALPKRPLTEMPELFKIALRMGNDELNASDEDEVSNITGLAGVVVLRDRQVG